MTISGQCRNNWPVFNLVFLIKSVLAGQATCVFYYLSV